MKKKTRILGGITLWVLILAASFVRAGLPFFTLAEIRPGQKGLGYTVVLGTEVKAFSVEILGLIQNKSKDRNFILVKVSGTILRESGGIAAGMSGSPVFISGRLAGAISYAFDRSDPQYGLVTPIEDMLRLWEQDNSRGSLALAPSALLPAGLGHQVFPVETPLLVSGRRISSEMERLGHSLGLKPIAAAEILGASQEIAPPLEPGSAVAAVFALGDYSAVAIGTVTWVDGKRFLAFGHPVSNRGAVDYPATGVYIHRLIANIDIPFKLGVPLNPVGRFVQDRGAGSSGVMNEAADTVLVKAMVQDKSTGRKKTYQTAVVREAGLLRSMCLSALLDAIDQTLDQYMPGTARVTLKIEAEGLDQPLIRRNLFYDNKDIAATALSEVGEAMDLLAQNDFREIKLKAITFDVSLSSAPQVATVVGAKADRERVRPGEQVRVEVELRPFRAASIIIPFTVTVPANAGAGKLILTARGGFVPPLEDDQGKDQASFSQLLQVKHATNLAEYIALFTDRPRNNDLILEYLPIAQIQEDEENALTEPIVQIQGCDFVVRGEAQIILDVELEKQQT